MCVSFVNFIVICPPSRPNEVLGLDFDSAHLAILGALLDVGNQSLLLLLQLGTLAIEFSLGLFKGSLMLPQSLGWRHALAEGPFYDLGIANLSSGCVEGRMMQLTFILADEYRARCLFYAIRE